MSDSSRNLTSEELSISEYTKHITQSLPVKTKSTAKYTSYMSSLKESSTSARKLSQVSCIQIEENKPSLSYAEILIQSQPLGGLVEKFYFEAKDRFPRSSQRTVSYGKITPIVFYPYDCVKVLTGELVVLKSKVRMSTVGVSFEVKFSDIAGIIVGARGSTFLRYSQQCNSLSSHGFYMSLVLQTHTVDFCIENLGVYLSVYMRISRAVEKRVTYCMPLLNRLQLIAYLVRSKLHEEASERRLSLTQLFVLGLILLARLQKSVTAEMKLMDVLGNTLNGTNRLYHIAMYTVNFRKHKGAALSGKNKKEWRRSALINIKRYWKYRDRIRNGRKDQDIDSLLKRRGERRRISTDKLFVPSLHRLFK